MNNLAFLDAKKVADFFSNNSFNLFGKITIHYYAITMVFALVACAVVATWLFPKRGFKRDLVIDVMIAIIPCAIFGARLWYVLLDLHEFTNPDGTFNFLSTLKIWEGGLAIHGGIAGGALGLFIIAKIHKIELTKLLDIGATMLPLGQAIGRWGNFFNQEVYGTPTSITTFPFAVYIDAKQGYFHALFFYEMVLNVILLAFLLLFFFKYNGKRSLYSASFYLIGYGVIRACLEPLRSKEFQMGNHGIPSSVLTSIASIIIGVVILIFIIRKDINDNNFWWKDFFKNLFKKQPQGELVAETSVSGEEIQLDQENLPLTDVDVNESETKTENENEKNIAISDDKDGE